MVTWHNFHGMIPGLSPVHLPPNSAEYCENVFIGKGDALYPERNPLAIKTQFYNPDTTPFTGTPITIWKSGDSWFAWDHFITVIRDPRHFESVNAFLFVDKGKIWRMSDVWLKNGQPALPIGVDRPTDAPQAKLLGAREWEVPFPPVSDVPSENVPPFDQQEDGSQPGEIRVYLYTLVNSQGEESAPSLPSEPLLVPPQRIVSLTAASTNQKNIIGWRWYRSVPAEDGTVSFKYVTQTDMPGLQDMFDPIHLGDIIETGDHFSLNDQIPAVVPQGICRIGTTGVVVWDDHNLFVSEHRLPHAYNPASRHQLPHKIVTCVATPELAETQNSFICYALTDHNPFTVVHNDTASVFEHEVDEPCLSPMLATAAEGTCTYVSNRGLVQLSGSSLTGATDEIMTLPSWERLLDDDMQLIYNQERFYLFGSKRSWVFVKSLYARDRMLSFSASTNKASACLGYGQNDIFFVEGSQLYKWGDGVGYMQMKWRSRQEQMLEYFNPGAVKVDMGLDRTGTASVSFFCNKRLWATKECKSQQPHHLPRQGKGLYWQMEITAKDVVYRIMAEKSIGDMAIATENRTEG